MPSARRKQARKRPFSALGIHQQSSFYIQTARQAKNSHNVQKDIVSLATTFFVLASDFVDVG
jgi:hypothetical protein